jgi:hypothetical protein
LPDYNAPQVSFSAQTLSIPEGNKDTTVQLGIQLKGENRTQVMVKYQVNGLTATAGSDYEAITEGKIFIKPGEISVSIPFKIFGDAVKETDEKIEIVIVQGLNATVIEPTRLTLTLVNDDFSLIDKINIHNEIYITENELFRLHANRRSANNLLALNDNNNLQNINTLNLNKAKNEFSIQDSLLLVLDENDPEDDLYRDDPLSETSNNENNKEISKSNLADTIIDDEITLTVTSQV